MLNRLRKLRRDNRGVAAIEFALLLPFLLVLLIGCLEVTFKIWSTQKAEKLAVTMADVIAQSNAVTFADLEKLTDAVDKIMDPFPFGDNGKVIISSIYMPEDETEATVNWQCTNLPTGSTYDATSKVGLKGDEAILPVDFETEMLPKDNVIVAEIFYTYYPIAPGLMFNEAEIYRRAFFKPRLGNLIVAPTGC